jgi:hypothetical protein
MIQFFDIKKYFRRGGNMFVLKAEDVTVKKGESGSDEKIEALTASDSLSKESDVCLKERLCAIWPNLLLFLKRMLGDAEPAENGNGSLFELRLKDGKFTLLTQPWAAEILKVPTKITFSTSRPEMLMYEAAALIKKPQIKH